MKYAFKNILQKNSNSTITILQVSNVWFNRRQPDSHICSYSQYSFETLMKKPSFTDCRKIQDLTDLPCKGFENPRGGQS